MDKVTTLTSVVAFVVLVASAVAAQDRAADLMKQNVTACDLHIAMSEVVPQGCQKKYRTVKLGKVFDDKLLDQKPEKRVMHNSAAIQVNFERESFTLTPDAKRVLGEIAKFMFDPQYSSAKFAIVGHTDAS